jgi:hypothetical protein
MPRYLISFDEGAMDHIPAADWPEVGEASHAVVREARAAGVWVFGGGLEPRQQATVVQPDGTVGDGPAPGRRPVVGGFAVVDVATRAEAERWAALIAAGCRCPQDVREMIVDPES